jgi:hypothetical protein
MPITVRAVALSLLILAFGCESSVSPLAVSVPIGPHHGTTLALDEKKGVVEFVNEPEVGDRRNPQPTSIVVYFLQSDSKSPLSPAPSEVNFTLESSGARAARGGSRTSSQSIPLIAEPKTDDPAGSSRFASKLGAYDLTSVRGTLSAKIDGQNVSITFAGAR